ncbi:MAG: cellulose biosynthesis cyclic di-GMP-binding regulatory protein BcsB [Campylobacterales bacterium]|nr:cellulose biosynthesis cyclic di-GMP-binding regulatory protein BcsB [Campylobacterales bacterium]
MLKLMWLIWSATMLLASPAVQKDPITTQSLGDGTQLVRIALNYVDPTIEVQRIRGTDGMHSISLPIPGNWEVLGAKGYIKYDSSILLMKDHSAGLVLFNDAVVAQFRVFDNTKTGVKFEITPELFQTHNTLTLEFIQHYTHECEDGSSSELWSDVHLEQSYVEFHVKIKPIPEEVRSIVTHLLDDKQYEVSTINYVLSDQSDEELRRYLLFTAATANHLKYRILPIDASNTLRRDTHNVIIGKRDRIKTLLNDFAPGAMLFGNPLLSLFFNDRSVTPWLLNDPNIRIDATPHGLAYSAKDAFSGESLLLQGGAISLQSLPFNLHNSATVAFWINVANEQSGTLFSFASGYRIGLHANRLLIGTAQEELSLGEKKLTPGWHHVIVSLHHRQSALNRIYIDGAPVATAHRNASAEYANLSGEAVIGGDSAANVMIDQFYLFTSAYTDEAAASLYRLSSLYRDRGIGESLFIDEKIAHDINVIKNPYAPDKAIVVITPVEEERIVHALHALYKQDLSLYRRQGLDIASVEIPEPAKAYSAKSYIPINEKIYFKELGYETTVLKGWYPPKVSLNFKVYPDHYFDDKDRIKTHLRYVFPNTVNKDSVVNIYLNNRFAKQIDIMKASESGDISLSAGELFSWIENDYLPAYLVSKGYNKLLFDFSLIPQKKGHCAIHNTENLVAMILDDSYFILPESKRWIEMPYLQLVSTSTYPYSIYPDLQQTQFFLANTHPQTVAASMNFIFFLAQEMGSFPFYAAITSKSEQIDDERHLIAFGSIHDAPLQSLSSDAPVNFEGSAMHKPYPFVSRFVEHKNILDDDRTIKHRFYQRMHETNRLDSALLMQLYRSPKQSDKTYLMFAAESPNSLNQGISTLFDYSNRHLIQGDTLLFDPIDQDGVAFDIKQKYILTSMNWFDRISLIVSANPARYMIVLFIVLILTTWLLRKLLIGFKQRHHKHVA